VTPDQIDVVFVAQLLCVWRLVANKAQSRDAASFLVDGNNGLDLAKVAQIIDELSKLRCALDIASEKNERPGLHAPKQAGGFRIEFFARNTGHDQLTKGNGLHWVET
jgi:hypothetical protein